MGHWTLRWWSFIYWVLFLHQARLASLKREEEVLQKDKERLESEKQHHLRWRIIYLKPGKASKVMRLSKWQLGLYIMADIYISSSCQLLGSDSWLVSFILVSLISVSLFHTLDSDNAKVAAMFCRATCSPTITLLEVACSLPGYHNNTTLLMFQEDVYHKCKHA